MMLPVQIKQKNVKFGWHIPQNNRFQAERKHSGQLLNPFLRILKHTCTHILYITHIIIDALC